MGEPPPAPAATCRRCAAELSPGRFCTNCGARADVAGSPRVVDPHGPDLGAAGGDQLRRVAPSARFLPRWRSAIVVTPLVAALVVSGGIGAQMLWAQIPPPDETAQTVDCWNDERRPRAECTLPTGTPGLRYVFPSFARAKERCTDVLEKRSAGDRPQVWQCRARPQGQRVVITYSELNSVEGAVRYHDRVYGDDARTAATDADGAVVRYFWRDSRDGGSGPFRMTAMYADFPFGVTVSADTPRVRDRAFCTLVESRRADEITARRS